MDDANSIHIMQQSIFSVQPGKPKSLDCAQSVDGNMNVEMGAVQTRHVEMHESEVLCDDDVHSLPSAVNLPTERNNESLQDNSNLDLERQGSKADLERERGIADVEAGCSDAGNASPLSQKQNQTHGQEDFGQCASFGDRVCRVCYLGCAAQPENGPTIELGCECKLDLAVAHRQCAEAWFKVKGDRTCEICGKTVHNVDGNGDAIFMENWNDGGPRAGEMLPAAHWWRSHRLFNVLLAIMVLAFVLPWLFHVSSFIT